MSSLRSQTYVTVTSSGTFCNPNLVTGVFTVFPFSPVVTDIILLDKTSTSDVSLGTTNSFGFTTKCTAADLMISPLTAKTGIS